MTTALTTAPEQKRGTSDRDLTLPEEKESVSEIEGQNEEEEPFTWPNQQADPSDIQSVNGGSEAVKLKKPLNTSGGEKSIKLIQKWKGEIISVTDESFLARLNPIAGESEVEREADILKTEVGPEVQDLIRPGAEFYWSIGYLDQPSGRTRISRIRFRRLPNWQKNEIKEAKESTSQLKNSLDERIDNSPQ